MTAPTTLRRALLVASLISVPLSAQQVSLSAAPTARPAVASAASDLRNLVTAQEAYFAENGRYASDLAATQFRASTGNAVRLVRAESNRYGAELTGSGFEGSCVIHIGLGSTELPRTAKEGKAFPEGEPACDGDGEVEEVRWASAASFEVQRVLSSIAKLQEQRFGRTGAYAAALEELTGLRPNANVKVTMQVTPAGGRVAGYLVTATHGRYPVSSCVVRSGAGPWMRSAMTAQGRRPMGDLQVTCDEFRR